MSYSIHPEAHIQRHEKRGASQHEYIERLHITEFQGSRYPVNEIDMVSISLNYCFYFFIIGLFFFSQGYRQGRHGLVIDDNCAPGAEIGAPPGCLQLLESDDGINLTVFD